MWADLREGAEDSRRIVKNSFVGFLLVLVLKRKGKRPRVCGRAREEEAGGKDRPPAQAVHSAAGGVRLAQLLARQSGAAVNASRSRKCKCSRFSPENFIGIPWQCACTCVTRSHEAQIISPVVAVVAH